MPLDEKSAAQVLTTLIRECREEAESLIPLALAIKAAFSDDCELRILVKLLLED